MARLTVIIPCKNEQQNIRGCVTSARQVADEILVADSGSSDQTVEIARSLDGVRVVRGEWVDYPTFKNWAIPQAEHEWVLIVDADERIPPGLANEIRAAVDNPPDELDGYWIGFRCFFLGHELKRAGYNSAAFRLFRRDRCRYGARRVHEEIEVDPQRAGRLRERFDHYSIWSYDQYFEKYVRYTRMGAEELRASGKRAGFVSLLVRPMLRFLQLYLLRGGFRDGLPGLQICMLTAFFNTFVKQARLWELQHAHGPDELDQVEVGESHREGRRAA